MKKGTVIIDMAASTGGNCEVTQNNEVIDHNGVRILGKSDFPSDMPSDASKMLSKNILNFIHLLLDEKTGLHINFNDEIIKGTCLTYHNEVINEKIKNII